jgi:hypothetical protein
LQLVRPGYTPGVPPDGDSQPKRRPAAGTAWLLGVLLMLTVMGVRCLPHPVGPARTYTSYEAKARTTAESALSHVATVRLAARNAADDRLFGPYFATLVSDAEEALSGLESTFASIQPPNERADAVLDELGELLGDALDHVRQARIAARRGESVDARLLDEDARALARFTERHS